MPKKFKDKSEGNQTGPKGEKIAMTPPELGTPVQSAKIHKDPIKWRLICAASQGSLRNLSIWIGQALDHLAEPLRIAWADEWARSESKLMTHGS